MTTPAEVIQIAISQIGYQENPPFSNMTKYGEWYGMNGVPWAATFVSYCFYYAGLPLEITTEKGFAYHPYAVEWFKEHGWWYTKPEIGDVVFFDWDGDEAPDHVGIVEKINLDGSIDAIEGNTSVGDDSNGGQVMRCNRRQSVILGYGRPPYLKSFSNNLL